MFVYICILESTGSPAHLIRVPVLPVPFAARPVHSLCPLCFCLLQMCTRPCSEGPCSHSLLLLCSHRRWRSWRRSPAVWSGLPPSCSSVSFPPSAVSRVFSAVMQLQTATSCLTRSLPALRTYEELALVSSPCSLPLLSSFSCCLSRKH